MLTRCARAVKTVVDKINLPMFNVPNNISWFAYTWTKNTQVELMLEKVNSDVSLFLLVIQATSVA